MELLCSDNSCIVIIHENHNSGTLMNLDFNLFILQMSRIRRMIEESDERGQTTTDILAADGVTTPDLVPNTSTESTRGNGDNHDHLNDKLCIFAALSHK